ncbi:SH3 domain-containing protein [Sutcliffiella horikoshii]|uniref:SH3 domain-containing protein n=1 Tax=Sutcliffiella horikoshii TaxID=79883 RepID=UPI00203F6A26|nr:SH3 domain-containing protein [Sutcliffiella horikoshii]MCM3619265.1 SH3 domain-containing protein [Sutcliffiella horikoshii]
MGHKLSIFLTALLLFTTIFSFMNASPAEANRTVVVATDVLNVRETPETDGVIISKVQRGESYPVVDSQGEWLKIQVTSTKAGWVASFLVKESSEGARSTASRAASSATVQVLTDDLRMRSGPGTNFSVVGTLHSSASAVQYLEENENWVKVHFDGVEGWVAKEYVTIAAKKQEAPAEQPAEPSEEAQGKVAIITTDGLNIRSEPSTQGEVLGSLSDGQQVEVLAIRGEWINISYDGTVGWVHSDYAKIGTSGSGEQGVQTPKTGATIKVSGLNVRSEPSLNGKILEQLPQGTSVTILSELNNWCEIEYGNGETGWIAGWFLERSGVSSPPQSPATSDGTIVIVDDATNIRNAPSTNAKVVLRASEGEEFSIVGQENDWYKIKLKDGSEAYVAGWIVATKGSAPNIARAGAEQYLSNKVIVIDPGHGGRDVGAIGVQGTYEKNLTLRTSLLLQDKLRAAGATVYMTRQQDTSVPLHARPQMANYHQADAFISVHYDSIDDSTVTGTTTFYYSNSDKSLADSVHSSLIQFTNLRDRSVRQENYLVLRESTQPSLLLELGYISNRGEEMTVISGDFQERASTAIYQGLAQYFRGN